MAEAKYAQPHLPAIYKVTTQWPLPTQDMLPTPEALSDEAALLFVCLCGSVSRKHRVLDSTVLIPWAGTCYYSDKKAN